MTYMPPRRSRDEHVAHVQDMLSKAQARLVRARSDRSRERIMQEVEGWQQHLTDVTAPMRRWTVVVMPEDLPAQVVEVEATRPAFAENAAVGLYTMAPLRGQLVRFIVHPA